MNGQEDVTDSLVRGFLGKLPPDVIEQLLTRRECADFPAGSVWPHTPTPRTFGNDGDPHGGWPELRACPRGGARRGWGLHGGRRPRPDWSARARRLRCPGREVRLAALSIAVVYARPRLPRPGRALVAVQKRPLALRAQSVA